jgi:hypothetical protein
MSEENKLRKMELFGGPHDGETIEIHEDNLKIKPIISVETKEGQVTEYGVTRIKKIGSRSRGKFSLPDMSLASHSQAEPHCH